MWRRGYRQLRFCTEGIAALQGAGAGATRRGRHPHRGRSYFLCRCSQPQKTLIYSILTVRNQNLNGLKKRGAHYRMQIKPRKDPLTYKPAQILRLLALHPHLISAFETSAPFAGRTLLAKDRIQHIIHRLIHRVITIITDDLMERKAAAVAGRLHKNQDRLQRLV